jgi:hypothetical protein
MDSLVDLLAREGVELRFSLDGQVAKDIVDDVFGLGFSRQMKGLLRDAQRAGLEAAGLLDLEPDRRITDRVWEENRQYVDHIKADLRQALRSGEFEDLDDVRRWFEGQAWREELMGRYLAKQGIEAGFAQGREAIAATEIRFRWTLGPVQTHHCDTCLDRSENGDGFTYGELTSLGFPGSTHLDCGANCRCSLVEI